MARAVPFLLALLVPSLEATQANLRQCSNSSGQVSRPSPEEEDAIAESKFPGWRTCQVNPWELSGHYEGDMLVANREELRNVIRDVRKKWPYQQVPFRFDYFYFYEHEIKKIENAINSFNNLTCVRLRPANETDQDYVLITGKRAGCSANIGRMGGRQELNLEAPACIYKRGCIYHQIMHALGFVHEHNSPVRDNYVTIMWNNVRKGKEGYFEKLEPAIVTDYGLGYDYYSIMHGGRKMFAKNTTLNTMETKDESAVIGQRQTLSIRDMRKIGRHYNC